MFYFIFLKLLTTNNKDLLKSHKIQARLYIFQKNIQVAKHLYTYRKYATRVLNVFWLFAVLHLRRSLYAETVVA